MLFHPTLIVQLCLFASAAQAADLFTTLRTVNASLFADAIQADLELTSIFLAPNVRAVFAPVDRVLSGIPRAKRTLWIRDEAQDPDVLYSMHTTTTQIGIHVRNIPSGDNRDANDKRSLPGDNLDAPAERSLAGEILETASPLVPSKRKGKKQVIIMDTGLGEDPVVPSNGSTVMRRHACNSPSLKLFTGLGNNVTVLRQRIPYDGGFIYTVDG